MTTPQLLTTPTVRGVQAVGYNAPMTRHSLMLGATIVPSRTSGGTGAGRTFPGINGVPGGGSDYFRSQGLNGFDEFRLGSIETSASYDLRWQFYGFPDRSIIRISIDGVTLGADVDGYLASSALITVTRTWTPPAGVGLQNHFLRFTSVGRNASNTTNYMFHLVALTLDRQSGAAETIALLP